MKNNTKIYNLSKFISIYAIIMILFQILILFDFEMIIPIMNISFPLLLSIISPVYFIIFYLHTLKNKEIKLNLFQSIKSILIIILIDFLISFSMIYLVDFISDTAVNANILEFESMNIEFKDIFTGLLWDLAGEEGSKLALYIFLSQNLINENLDIKIKEKRYIFIWIIISALFGLLHLTAYDFNILQCLLVIGLPTMTYGWLWKKTKNPLALWIAHVGYDAISLYLVFMI